MRKKRRINPEQDAAQGKMPKEAIMMSKFVHGVVEAATTRFPHEKIVLTELRCFEKGCRGSITSILMEEDGEINWQCSDCDCSGTITNSPPSNV